MPKNNQLLRPIAIDHSTLSTALFWMPAWSDAHPAVGMTVDSFALTLYRVSDDPALKNNSEYERVITRSAMSDYTKNALEVAWFCHLAVERRLFSQEACATLLRLFDWQTGGPSLEQFAQSIVDRGLGDHVKAIEAMAQESITRAERQEEPPPGLLSELLSPTHRVRPKLQLASSGAQNIPRDTEQDVLAGRAMSHAKRCRKCGAVLAAGAVLCVQCGIHQATGISARSLQTSRWLGRTTVALAVAGVIAFLGNILWFWIAGHLGDAAKALSDVGGIFVLLIPIYVALRIVHQRSVAMGALCSIIVIIGTIGGDAFFISHMMKARICKNIRQDPAAMDEVASAILVATRLEEQGRGIEDVPSQEVQDMLTQTLPEGKAMLARLSEDEKTEIVQGYANGLVQDMSWLQRWMLIYDVESAACALFTIGVAFSMGYREPHH